MYIKRIEADVLQRMARQFPIVALTGPRQSGKTTLVQKVFVDKPYVSFEDLDMCAFARNDPRGFLATYGEGAIFDEIQRVPELFSYLQGVVDCNKKQGQFILTGSQNFLLHERITQSLAGRVAMMTLLPLSIEEIKESGCLKDHYTDYLIRGFYPKLYDTSVDPSAWYANYILTYVERDVRLIKNISNLATFQLFLKMCAGRTGQLLNLSSLAHDCGITHNTAKSWLSILEASFVVFLLRPHHMNFKKRLVKMPKLYFFDTGVACSLLGITQSNQLESHPLKGNLFETFIVSEIMKYGLNRGQQSHCYFWRDKTGHEVDCIIEEGQDMVPVEIKSGKTIIDDYFSNLRYWSMLSGRQLSKAFVIYGGTQNQHRTSGTVVGWQDTATIFRKDSSLNT